MKFSKIKPKGVLLYVLLHTSCVADNKVAEVNLLKDQASFKVLNYTLDKKLNRIESELSLDSGYIAVGLNTYPLVKGFIPTALIHVNAKAASHLKLLKAYSKTMSSSTVTCTFDFLKSDTKAFSESRSTSLIDIKWYDEPDFSQSEGVYTINFGKMERDGITYIPTLYYSVSLQALVDNVPISKLVPLWNWHGPCRTVNVERNN